MTTLYVAAANSSDEDKARASFICDGVNDQEEINAAFAALGGNPGTVHLFDGDYRLSKSPEFERPTAIAIQASGQSLVGDGYATTLWLNDNQDCNVIRTIGDGLNHIYVSDLHIEANQAANMGGNWLETNSANFRSTGATPNDHIGVDGIWARESWGLNVYMGGDNNYVRDSVLGNATSDVAELISGSVSEISNNIAVVDGTVGYVFGTDQFNSATIRDNKTFVLDGGTITQEVNRLWPGYYANLLASNSTTILDGGTVNRFIGAYGYQNVIGDNEFNGSTVNSSIILNGLSHLFDNTLDGGSVEVRNGAGWPITITDNKFSDVDLITDPLTTASNNGNHVADGLIHLSLAEGSVSLASLPSVFGPSATYTIAGGADAQAFVIDPNTGLPAFVHTPDFEAPGSASGTNSYEIAIQASDGTVTQTLSFVVDVTNVNEAPVLDHALQEQYVSAGTRDVMIVSAHDPDAGSMLQYSIAGGADSAEFWIDPYSGRLRFVEDPDFRNPGDADGNNHYLVDVRVSDGTLTDVVSVEVVVTKTVYVAAADASDADKARADFVCDGVNDEAEINAAFAALGGERGSVHLLGGNYHVEPAPGQSAAITIAASGQSLTGDGYGTAIWFDDDQGGTIVDAGADGLSNVSVSGIRFQGDDDIVGGGVSSATAIDFGTNGATSHSDLTIHDIWIRNFAGVGIVAGGQNLQILDNSFEDIRGGSLAIQDQATAHVEGNHVSLTGAANFIFDAGNGGLIDIVGNLIAIRDGGSAGLGILLHDARQGSEVSQNNIRFEPENGLGTVLDISGAVSVDANMIVGFYAPLSLIVLADGTTFTNNYLQAVSVASGGGTGLDPLVQNNIGNAIEILMDHLSLDGNVYINGLTAPVFTSGGGADAITGAIAENSPLHLAFTAVDPDTFDHVTYSISGGADAALFDIDPQSGILTLKHVLDFEAPSDAGGDNVYEVVIQASDGVHVDTQALSLQVENVDEETGVVQNDTFSTTELSSISGNLFSDNGSGADRGGDSPLQIGAVNGSAVNVGDTITLASGALLRVNADGTFSYDPNGAWHALPAAGSGAINSVGSDSFTYTVSDGGTATVTIAVNGIDNDDHLMGDDGANVLNGGLGADVMVGLGGDDIYYVDNAHDAVVEAANGGTDLVYAAVDYALAEGTVVEVLSAIVQGAQTPLHLTGNEFDNNIWGNMGANVLDGSGGADRLIGLGGDDTYYVDNAGDVIVEAVNGGFDVVYASVDYALTAGAEVEVLSARVQAAMTALHLTGNEFANTIWGNMGANVLDGGGGADRLIGLGGDDTYYVDNAGDVIVEAVNGGFDVVYASVDYALTAGSEVEVLSARIQAATSQLHLTGNEFANAIWGNMGVNVLDGGAGDDRLIGLGGDDMLIGGAGQDVAVFRGDFNTYSLVSDGGKLAVLDLAPQLDGDDGKDTLDGVEFLEFKDGHQIGLADAVILDLDGNGVSTLSARDSSSAYDMNHDGQADDTSWFGPGEGLLFLDRNGDGTLSDAKEASFIADAAGARSGLAGLSAFDSNQDGKLSAADVRFQDFGLWQDGNGDGVVEAGEIHSLSDLGIVSIDLRGTAVQATAEIGGVAVVNQGTYERDGSTMALSDAFLSFASNAQPFAWH